MIIDQANTIWFIRKIILIKKLIKVKKRRVRFLFILDDWTIPDIYYNCKLIINSLYFIYK